MRSLARPTRATYRNLHTAEKARHDSANVCKSKHLSRTIQDQLGLLGDRPGNSSKEYERIKALINNGALLTDTFEMVYKKKQ